MEAKAGMIAGSYRRNELVRIRHDSDSGVRFSLLTHFIFYFDYFFFQSVEYTLIRSKS
uniref:Cellulose synthase n=1 Tax=Rhizophora mucronata TaxID=61149 RepID=A0A2P2MNY3_RHIMU